MEMIVPKKEFVEGYPVWVGNDAPIDLKLRILAAIASYQFGVKGIDGMLTKYGEIWKAQLESKGAVTLQ